MRAAVGVAQAGARGSLDEKSARRAIGKEKCAPDIVRTIAKHGRCPAEQRAAFSPRRGEVCARPPASAPQSGPEELLSCVEPQHELADPGSISADQCLAR